MPLYKNCQDCLWWNHAIQATGISLPESRYKVNLAKLLQDRLSMVQFLRRGINIAFECSSVNKPTIWRWYVRFRSGETSRQYESWHGHRQKAVLDEILKNTIEVGLRQNVYSITDMFGKYHTTVVRCLSTITKLRSCTHAWHTN